MTIIKKQFNSSYIKARDLTVIKLKHISILCIFIISITISFRCSGDNKNSRTLETYSQLVGPEGGTVTDPNVASVYIPEGALDETTTITISTFQNSKDIALEHGITPFKGGADFGPDGLTFNIPVTITLPSSIRLVQG